MKFLTLIELTISPLEVPEKELISFVMTETSTRKMLLSVSLTPGDCSTVIASLGRYSISRTLCFRE
jgi:hypothetical protein